MRTIIQVENIPFLHKMAELVKRGNSVKIQLKGESMYPFLRGGRDCVILSPFDDCDLQEGQIVLAYLPAEKRYVLHRIYQRHRDRLRLMGDGNLKETEVCRVSDIRAWVRRAQRNGITEDLTCAKWQKRAKFWKLMLPVRRYLIWGYRLKSDPQLIIEKIKHKI